MLQYSIMKHSKKTTEWEVMTCKNSIISINKGYQETMYQNLSYDILPCQKWTNIKGNI